MGISANGARILLLAKQHAVAFSSTATIGRQGLHVTQEILSQQLTESGVTFSPEALSQVYARSKGYAEPLLELFGAKQIVSFDYSDYEGCSVVSDFNKPIPPEFHEKFDLVLDGGSLEHVFNFPQAIKNCMQMVRLGGHFLGLTPANFELGHGFYQFSPELFFRVFSTENGFSTRWIVLYGEPDRTAIYVVTDPKQTGKRTEFAIPVSTHMGVLAQRTAIVPIFEQPPLQSDYSSAWAET